MYIPSAIYLCMVSLAKCPASITVDMVSQCFASLDQKKTCGLWPAVHLDRFSQASSLSSREETPFFKAVNYFKLTTTVCFWSRISPPQKLWLFNHCSIAWICFMGPAFFKPYQRIPPSGSWSSSHLLRPSRPPYFQSCPQRASVVSD